MYKITVQKNISSPLLLKTSKVKLQLSPLYTNLQVVKLQRWEHVQRKAEKRQEEEITEKLKRFMMQEIARRLSEEALLVYETQDLNREQDRKIVVAIENAIQCYCVTNDKKKRATTQTTLDHFFKSIDRI